MREPTAFCLPSFRSATALGLATENFAAQFDRFRPIHLGDPEGLHRLGHRLLLIQHLLENVFGPCVVDFLPLDRLAAVRPDAVAGTGNCSMVQPRSFKRAQDVLLDPVAGPLAFARHSATVSK